MSASPTARRNIITLTAALAAGAVYAYGATPSIYVGDSGELVAAVGTLGIPHPSGYPLYILLGKLWTLLCPLGSVAYRMSLFSAAAAAATCAVVLALARRAALHTSATLLAAGLVAFGASFWSQANIQRVYTLNALFVALATALAFAWHTHRQPRHLLAAFFVCGLGATNHTFMALYGLALGLFMLACEPHLMGNPIAAARRLAAIATSFALGLLPYAYLPIRSRMNPRLDWGNPETLGNFLDVVIRRDFWQRAWIESPADGIAVLWNFFSTLGPELTWPGVALALLGLATARRSRRPALLCVLVIAVNVAAMALHGSRSDIFIWHRYYIPSYMMLAVLAAMGWQELVPRLPPRAAWAVLVLPAALLASGFRDFDRSRYWIAEDFAEAVLEAVPPGANLIATDDNVLFVLIYLHLVEGRRPDLNLILQGVGKADLPPLRFDPETDPLYFTHHPNWDLPSLQIVPLGSVYRAWQRGRPQPPPTITRTQLAGEHDDRVPKDYLTQNLLGHFHYTLGFTYERRDWPRARAQFAAAASVAADNDVLFYNLGLVFARNGLWKNAVDDFTRSHEINPRHIASISQPRAADKLGEARRELARLAVIELEASTEIGQAVENGTAAFHRLMAAALDKRGEALAARGHRLLAEEIEYNMSP